ncbi:MAG TPA: serine/threonine-protein kinase, partial [Polyangiaceae bacterium]|nr:serine/threonine-protein kinase [Polyangiaceae bacterium]
MIADDLDVEPESSVPVSREQSLIGSTLLDTYVVDRALGEGGMGRIYDAHHRRIPEKRFAIKVLRPELLWSAQVRTRFEREGAALARISHPSVLSIVDVGKTPSGLPFMVSEHLSGLDLLAYLRRFGRLPCERVIQLGCRLAEALEAIHAQGVIHRDVKPGNIFLLGAFAPLGPEWDRVKLIDFGLSRFSGGDDELTKNGIVMGTPAYMSPEQARGSRADHLTDVYGVGAVLYAAATGVAPFPEETPRDTLMAVLQREPVRPRTLNPEISEGLEIVIQRALSKRPEQRQPSMSALRLELANLELASAGKRPAPRPSGASLGGVRARLFVLGAGALLLLLGAAANIAHGLGELGIDRRLELGERLLLLGLFGIMLAMLGIWLGRLDRSTWQNSARLADRLPRLEAPLFAGVLVYGLGSFALRL